MIHMKPTTNKPWFAPSRSVSMRSHRTSAMSPARQELTSRYTTACQRPASRAIMCQSGLACMPMWRLGARLTTYVTTVAKVNKERRSSAPTAHSSTRPSSHVIGGTTWTALRLSRFTS